MPGRIPKCRRPECPRSDTKIIVDEEKFVTIRCFTCGSIQVKPSDRVEGRAKVEIKEKRIQEAINRERARSRKPKIFV